jgi:hypothetical protein
MNGIGTPNSNSQLICIFAGPLAFIFILASSICTGGALPMSSTLTAAQVVALYQQHLAGIRHAALLMTFGSALMMIYAAAISAQLQRIERVPTPWTFVQLMGGVLGNLPFLLTAIIWTVVAFRLDRPPEITQAMNDLSWFILEMPAATADIQFLAIIVVVLGDRSPDPVFPKWVAYINIAAAILFLPGAAGGIFVDAKSMDWNGFITYLMPGLASASWIWIMFAALLRAHRRSRRLTVPATA